MAELWINAEGVIERAEGDTEPLLGFRTEELAGLPCELLHPRLTEPGLHTLWLRRRDGQTVLVHAFVEREPEPSACRVYLEDVFGGEAERARLAFQYALFRGLAFAAEFGDPDLLDHLRRVGRYTSWVARGALGLSEEDVVRLTVAAYVHDVGKSAIPREILYKPAPLNEEEYALVKTHTDKGFAVLQEVEWHVKCQSPWLYDELTWQWGKDVARYHHENWNGSGYPAGLAGEGIPLAARVVKVVDVLDALLHVRPYKSAWSNEQVCREIMAKTGTEFDPKLASWLLAHEAQWRQEDGSGSGGDELWWP